MAPRMATLTWPPRIMPKDVAESKMLPPGEHGDGLLAGVDEVGVFLAFVGEGAHAEQAVFALQDHADAVGQVVGHQRGDADAQVDVVAVVQFLGRDGSHFIPGPGHGVLLGLEVVGAGRGSAVG